MNDRTDQQLLRDYSERRSEAAFTELVRRHVDLVHSAAFRMTGEMHSAQDITQAVFVALAQNAARLTHHPVLSGWLHTTARNLAAKNVRAAVRRQNHEQEAAAMNELLSTAPDASWEEIAPHLDAALGELTEPERNAVLLRYFEKRSAPQMAESLGITDDAAQKRVSRAVERLREFFAKRGVSVGAGGLVVVISANAVQAAPVGLAATISAAALAVTAVSATAVVAVTTKAVAMTTLQKTLVAAALAVTVGTGIYQTRQASELRTQVQTLVEQQAPLTAQIQQLERERDDAANRSASMSAEIAAMKSKLTELVKLRGEIARLRDAASQANDPFIQTALAWKAKEAKLRKLFEERPGQRIPEMQFLPDRQWLDIARDSDLDSEDGISSALSSVRNKAKEFFVPMMQKALNNYVEANKGNQPDSLSLLGPYFAPPVDDAVLQRYELLDKKAQEWSHGPVVVEKAVVDSSREGRLEIGPHWSRVGSAPIQPKTFDFPPELRPALKAYESKNNGQLPNDLAELKAYITTPEQEAALEKLLLLLHLKN